MFFVAKGATETQGHREICGNETLKHYYSKAWGEIPVATVEHPFGARIGHWECRTGHRPRAIPCCLQCLGVFDAHSPPCPECVQQGSARLAEQRTLTPRGWQSWQRELTGCGVSPGAAEHSAPCTQSSCYRLHTVPSSK